MTHPEHRSVIAEISEGETELLLEPAETHVVRVLDEHGRPLSAALVVMHDARDAVAFPDAFSAYSSGNPGSAAPVHVGRTVDDGSVSIGGLPKGTYAVQVVDEWRCPDLAQITIDVPGPPTTIFMTSLRGIAATAAVPIQHCAFKFKSGEPQRSVCASLVAERLRSRLSGKFAGCKTFVALPKPGERPVVSITAFLVDGSRATGEWELQPLADIAGPVFLDIVGAAGMGTLTVRLNDRQTQRAMLGVPMVAVSTAGGPGMRFESGSPVSLPAGDYNVGVDAHLSWFDDAIGEGNVTVRASENTNLDVEVPWFCTPVAVSAEVEDGVVDVPLQLACAHDAVGVSSCRFNLRPKDMPVVFWCPPGDVRFSARGPHLRTEEKTIKVDGQTEQLKVAFFVEREPAAR